MFCICIRVLRYGTVHIIIFSDYGTRMIMIQVLFPSTMIFIIETWYSPPPPISPYSIDSLELILLTWSLCYIFRNSALMGWIQEFKMAASGGCISLFRNTVLGERVYFCRRWRRKTRVQCTKFLNCQNSESVKIPKVSKFQKCQNS